MRIPVRPVLIAALLGVPLVWLAVHGIPSFRSAMGLPARTAPAKEGASPGLARARQRHESARVASAGEVAEGPAPQAPAAPSEPDAPSPLSRLADRVEGLLLRLGLILAAVCGPVVGLRLRARRRRRVVRYRIACPRAEDAAPERVAGLIEAWHRVLQRERGITRLFFGQPHLALEWHSLPDPAHPGAPCEVVACVVCPPELAPELDRGLAACYPNARLGYEFTPPPAPWEASVGWSAHMVRLVKTRPFLYRAAARSERGEGLSVVEAAMAAAGARERAVGVQIRLAPAPRIVERWARWRLEGRERRLEAARRGDPRAGAGVSAPSARRELLGGLELLDRGLFWSEVWVMGSDAQGVRSVAGTLQAAGGENALARRRPWSPLHRLRVHEARPGFLSPSVMGAAEIACLWHLPAPAAGGVSARRNHLPRLPAPRAVPRAARPSEGLVEDERGPLTLPSDARLLGIAVDGLSGTGKTEALAAVARLSAADPGAWLCVLDPKSDLVERALSVIPETRRVRVLNFAEPFFGINPLEADADPEAIAEAVIGGLRDVHEEGDIRASSDRYLRLAIVGVIAYGRSAGERPTLWLVKDLLDPSSGDELRKRVVRVAQRDPALAHVAAFFDRTLPDQLQNARSMTTTKLDAPANKLYRFLGQIADRVLHHPAQLRIQELVREREILIVDGAMGRVGEDTSRKLMQILMRLIYAEVQRQQELPHNERVRMCVVFDEAHFILNPTIAKAAAVGRSGRLELAAGFQQLAQFQDPVVRAMVEDLLQHRMTFRAAAEDARQAAAQAMQSYADVIRDDPRSRELQRVAPDMLTNLPDHHCLCSWVVAGTRQPAFIGRTLQVAIDRERIAAHLASSRARPVREGALPHFPPVTAGAPGAEDGVLDRRMPGAGGDDRAGPETSANGRAHPSASRPHAAAHADERAGGQDGAAPPELPDAAEDPPAVSTGEEGPREPSRLGGPGQEGGGATSEAIRNESAEAGSLALPGESAPTDAGDGAPESYAELRVAAPLALVPDRRTPRPRPPRPARPVEQHVLVLLYKVGFLLGSQIARETGWNVRTVQRALVEMLDQGWVRRFSLRTGDGGRPRHLYMLSGEGFAAARTQLMLVDPAAPDPAAWREPDVRDPRRVLHDLHAAAWLMTFGRMLPPGMVCGWHGPRASLARPAPPLRTSRGEGRRAIRLEEVPLDADRSFAELRDERFGQIRADGMVELALPTVAGVRRIDLFVELDRTRKPARNLDKMAAYDAFITAWSTAMSRYQALGDRPLVVFVCEDEAQARAFARAADVVLSGRVITLRTPPERWRFPGRERTFFCCERDIHEGSLRAWQVPALPPDVRRELGHAREPEPVPQELVTDELVRRARAPHGGASETA